METNNLSGQVGDRWSGEPSGTWLAVDACRREAGMCFGVIPNLFNPAWSAPGAMAALWAYARTAYINNPLPAVTKERIFVYLSRMAPASYSLARHVGFLTGRGKPAGNATVQPQSVSDVIALLQLPLPNQQSAEEALQRFQQYAPLSKLPEPGSPLETDMLLLLGNIYLLPQHAHRVRESLKQSLTDTDIQWITALLSYIHAEHCHAAAQNELYFEPDLQELFEQEPALGQLIPGTQRRSHHSISTDTMIPVPAELANTDDVASQPVSSPPALLQHVLDITPVGISILKPIRNDDGSIVDFRLQMVNKELETEAGRGDLAGKLSMQEYPEIRHTGLYDMLVRVMQTGEPETSEYRYVKDGMERWYATAVTRVDDTLIASNLDITHRKLAAEERSRSLNLMEQSEALAQMGSWEYDLRTKVMTWSVGMYRLFRVKSGTPVLPDTLLQYVHPKSSDAVAAMIQSVRNGEELTEQVVEMLVAGENRIMRVKVRSTPDVEGRMTKLMGVYRDITQSRRSREQIIKDTAMIKGFADAAPDMLYVIDLLTLQMVYVNNRIEELFDKTALEIKELGQTFFETVVYNDDKQIFRDNIQALKVSDRGEVIGLTYRLYDHHQQLHWIKTRRTVYLRDEQGQPTHIIGISQDITEQMELQERNRQLNNERLALEESQQQEIFKVTLQSQEKERKRIAESLHNGLGQLLYGVKLSLNQISTKNPMPANEEALRHTEQLITDCIRETRRISHELMPAVLEDFGLKEAMLDICRQLSGDTKFQCHFTGLEVKLDKDLEVAIYRIIQELMINVLKHAGASIGKVNVEIALYSINIVIEDNGKGMQPDIKSNGIGLSSVNSKVKLLKGRIEINSLPGGGTKVNIQLPHRLG
ncbi:PAS domain-containing protein [Mucilaginibacter sp. CSA2-8R]|uniref:PAS domain-containing sensor histidine kinase n=1 Tax=Mucilaginibacter sp. CSA2-8R TaxID=3141542 RepID=UPI00315DE4EF